MNKVNFSEAVWRKSSYSSGNGQCVETASLGEVVAARDSKDPHGTALTFSAEEWAAFINAVKAERFA
ncbi:DUF397 domain-containing protein [Streptantibioticus ferralitis]|uniref:DUF397 domain-containing protein n=1 Tax=Streptantibioticus ferralitis TaxID=236510 RepID=A0ABT5YUS2_9ACTN|nr:DUF397 domain-containing protein [Streptantibioticus ferralitis]MDF2255349.1 DUF397 domain-containing protein [Streptantibioticus ferralitis]